jgi:hypothetical protein
MPAPRNDVRSGDDSKVEDRRNEGTFRKISETAQQASKFWLNHPHARRKGPMSFPVSYKVGGGGGGGSSGSSGMSSAARSQATSIVKKRKGQPQGSSVARAMNG